ncbi:MAG: uracil-DNA glycosylase, partial [Anaerolineaceae bacterium]|nr:uracil-DNA glycosylase [Anaerolineaceae bacterium]
RMFTGDSSGDFLFPALYTAGFVSQPESISLNDGLILKDVFITAVCRCAPPKNKPAHMEMLNCRKYLLKEILLLKKLKGVVALGGIAFNNIYDILREMFEFNSRKRPGFAHGKLIAPEESPYWILASYHPSRQNTQTGRLTKAMFSNIWSQVKDLIN